MPELRECPFCGGTIIERCYFYNDAAECENCGLLFTLTGNGFCRNTLREKLNARAESEARALTVEELGNEVFKILGNILGSPCDNGFDGYMFEQRRTWCEKICGSVSDSMCWEELIYAKYKELAHTVQPKG